MQAWQDAKQCRQEYKDARTVRYDDTSDAMQYNTVGTEQEKQQTQKATYSRTVQ